VTTGAAGSSASATVTGTAPNQTLNLTIPRGDEGTDGADVEFQASGTHIQWRYVGGSTWTDLVALSAITGPAGAAGETGPTGAAGAAGSAGAAGAAATIAIGTVTTGAAGSSASVTNSGSSSAAVIDFTIPRGNTGSGGVSLGLVLALS
jgi:hypothetical protein